MSESTEYRLFAEEVFFFPVSLLSSGLSVCTYPLYSTVQ